MNASNQSIGCRGTSLPIHFLVYWVGPCVSAYLMTLAIPHLKKLLHLEMDLEPEKMDLEPENKVPVIDQKTTNNTTTDKKVNKANTVDAHEDDSTKDDDSKKNSAKVKTSDIADNKSPKEKSL